MLSFSVVVDRLFEVVKYAHLVYVLHPADLHQPSCISITEIQRNKLTNTYNMYTHTRARAKVDQCIA